MFFFDLCHFCRLSNKPQPSGSSLSQSCRRRSHHHQTLPYRTYSTSAQPRRTRFPHVDRAGGLIFPDALRKTSRHRLGPALKLPPPASISTSLLPSHNTTSPPSTLRPILTPASPACSPLTVCNTDAGYTRCTLRNTDQPQPLSDSASALTVPQCVSRSSIPARRSPERHRWELVRSTFA